MKHHNRGTLDCPKKGPKLMNTIHPCLLVKDETEMQNQMPYGI